MLKDDAARITAACLQKVGKDLFSLQDSRAYVALLTAVLLTLEEEGIVEISDSHTPLRAVLHKKEASSDRLHLQLFLQTMPEEEPAMDFFERELKLQGAHREQQRKEYEDIPPSVVEAFLERVRTNALSDADSVALTVLWQADLAAALWDATERPQVEDLVEEIRSKKEALASWADSVPSIWMMRFVQS